MGILEYVLLTTTIAGATGWVFAWRSRGEALNARLDANAMAARARLAEAATETANLKAYDAEARAATATAQLHAALTRSGILESTLDAERKAKGELLEKLAKLGAPVGGALVDDVLDRLYPNPRGQGTDGGQGTGTSGNQDSMSRDATAGPVSTKAS